MTHWDERHREAPIEPPSPFLLGLADRLPPPGRAIDVAGGTGRHAAWLAARGWQVSLADLSPVALERAVQTTPGLRGLQIDLEREPFPAGPWELVCCFNFLWRPLFADFAGSLAPGGWLVVEHPTRRNLERHAHPSARFLLEEGELPGLVEGLEVMRYEEGWIEGRHLARLVACLRWRHPSAADCRMGGSLGASAPLR